MQISERTTRLVCRAAFCAGCVAPTLVVLALCLWQALPFQRYAAEDQLTAALGFRTTLGSIEAPRPHRTRLHDLALHDPETGELLARVERLDAGRVGSELVVWLSGITVTELGSPAIEELLLRRIRRRLAAEAAVVRVVCSDLRIEGERPLAFRTAAAHFEPLPSGAHARLTFESEQDKKVTIRLARRYEPQQQWSVELNHRPHAMPYSLLGELLPEGLAEANR